MSPTRCVLYHWLPYGCLSSLNIYIVTACQRNHESERESLLVQDALINVFNMCVMRPCYLHYHTLVCLLVYSYSLVIRNAQHIWFLMTGRVCLRLHSRTQTHSSMQLVVSVSGSGLSAFYIMSVCVCTSPLQSRNERGHSPLRWSHVMLGLTETLQTTFSHIREGQGYHRTG